MRLHRLEATAFGPFAGTVEVDFDAVGANGLFLVHGPTGAGKTSLLDAVCFALYAGVPGARPGGRALRSDHAAPDAVPVVRLEFSVGTRRFRVTRSPEFLRRKRRGDGVTRSPASVVLEESTGGRWRGVTTRADEVGELVTEVLGMGLAQFSKVVLLPQGEFAAFLRATADERRNLLEKLFDISTYAGVETWLADRRRALGTALAEAETGLAIDLARAEDVLGAVPAEVLAELPLAWADRRPAELPELVAEVRDRLERHAVACLAAAGDAEARVTAAQAQSVEAAALADRQRRGRAAQETLAALATDQERWTGLQRTVEAAARAQAVTGDLRALDRAEGRAATVARRVDSARTTLGRFGVDDWVAPTVAGWLATLDEHGATLEHALAAAGRLEEDRARLTELRARSSTTRTRLEAERSRVVDADQSVGQAEADLGHRERAAAAVTAATAVVDAWSEVHRLVVDRDAAGAEVATLQPQSLEARGREQDARTRFLDAQQARIDGMAAELADRLVDGEPCPVCGSPAHPAPAAPVWSTVPPPSSPASSTVPVSPAGPAVEPAAAVAAAEREWHRLRTAAETLQASLVAAQQRAATRSADLADALTRVPGSAAERDDVDATAAWSARGLAEARREADAAAATLRGLGDPHRRLEAARAERVAVGRSVEATERAAATAVATLAEVEDRVARGTATVVAAVEEHRRLCPCGSDATQPREVLAAHRGVRTTGTELEQALSADAEARTELLAVRSATSEALVRNGFPSAADAQQARLDPGDLEAATARLTEVQRRRAHAEGVLTDVEVVAALDRPEVDAVALAAATDAARAALRDAQHAQTGAEAAVRAFTVVGASTVARVDAWGPLAARAAKVAELADTATGTGGQNTLRMRLTAFVLAARLEKVAALANERLLVMGDGRYQLAHSDDLAAGGRRSGLGLVVRDQWTGQVRDTASLSGGESFMASLALALGLADAVREEAGGFDLGTLFVDEGFGTLDDESLDQVMSVLDGLRDGGRCVGVVSHVSDLRLRIPFQVRVDKTSTGSGVTILGLSEPAA